MKKNILIIAVFSTIFAHAMETNLLLEITNNSLSMLSHGTKINLIKESIFDPSSPIDITVVGYHQQHMHKDYQEPQKQGEIYFLTCSMIFEKNKDDDSASDDDTYKPYPNPVRQTYKGGYYEQKFCQHKIIKSKILTIGEPCISQACELNREGELIKNFKYCPRRSICSQEKLVIYLVDEAIQEASNDLVLCYKTSLTKGLQTNTSKANNSIALATLGADTGFPRELAAPIAVTTVLEWVKDNLQQYDSINLFVKKRSDFALYKKLLIQRCDITKKICLLYWAHKDNELLLSCLPHEIIDYIGYLCLVETKESS